MVDTNHGVYMVQTMKIEKSYKRGFGGQESYIVTRGRTSYLRIVGHEPTYSLMTATASEDDKSYFVCSNKVKLISSALQFSAKLGLTPLSDKDSSCRDFIHVCAINFVPGNQQEDVEQLYAILENFFLIYDTCDPTSHEAVRDMQEIYTAIAHDNSNEDIYLSDGVWLSVDGQLHDKGR